MKLSIRTKLTLAIGLPFPAEIRGRIQNIQKKLEVSAPGRITWYGAEHLHTTLFAPLRGRYREGPPLQREELPADLPDFTRELSNFFRQRQPFTLELQGVHSTPDGRVVVRENTLAWQLASCLQNYPKLDRSKHHKGLHINIGFFNAAQPFATDEERARFETALAQFIDTPVDRMTVGQVWLVHYANRTLNRIVGKVPFTLGRANALSVERLLQKLGVTASRNRLRLEVENKGGIG